MNPSSSLRPTHALNRAALTLACALAVHCSSPPPATDSGPAPDAADDVVDAFSPAMHPTLPQVPDVGHTVNAAPTLVVVTAQNDPLTADLQAFGDALAASHWWSATVAEYGIGAIARVVHAPGPAITTASISDSDIAAYAHTAGAAAGAPEPTGSVVYLVYLPPGTIELEQPGNTPNTDCRLHRGDHVSYRIFSVDNVAIVQRCPLETGEVELDELTEVASHEIVEAVTDPDGATGWTLAPSTPSTPWTSSAWASFVGPYSNELGDLCHDTRIAEAGHSYQRIWSNAAAMAGADPCTPAQSTPYYNTAPAQDWFTVAAGGSVAIPLTAWSSAPTDDWVVIERTIFASSARTFTASLSGATMQSIAGHPGAVVNNGGTATMTVQAPASAVSGDYMVFWLMSIRATPVAGQDLYHIWPVGVRVP